MEQLGPGYDAVRAINPDIIIASPCLMGEDGPAARSAGSGYHAAAVCGFYEVTGWSDRPPGCPFNAHTDTIAPRFLAATLVAGSVSAATTAARWRQPRVSASTPCRS